MKTEKFDGTQNLKPTDGSELQDFIKENKEKYIEMLNNFLH